MRGRWRLAQLDAQVADLGGGMGEQAGDLGFQCAGVDDLAERGVGGERKQITGHVEGAGLESALVGLGLQGFRAGTRRRSSFEDGGGDALVGGKEILRWFRSKAGPKPYPLQNQGNTSRI